MHVFLEMTSNLRIVAVCVIVELQTTCYLTYVPLFVNYPTKYQEPSSGVSLGIAVNRKATVNFASSIAIEEKVDFFNACVTVQACRQLLLYIIP